MVLNVAFISFTGRHGLWKDSLIRHPNPGTTGPTRGQAEKEPSRGDHHISYKASARRHGFRLNVDALMFDINVGNSPRRFTPSFNSFSLPNLRPNLNLPPHLIHRPMTLHPARRHRRPLHRQNTLQHYYLCPARRPLHKPISRGSWRLERIS